MNRFLSCLAAWLLGLELAQANGHWLSPVLTPIIAQHMQLMTDGSVLCNEWRGSNWFKLTPNTNGSYTNGTWTNIAPMHYGRSYFGSAILRDGRLIVAGGEYGSYELCESNYPNQRQTSEIYDPVTNGWTLLPPVPAGLGYEVGSWNTNYNKYFYDNGFVEPSAMLLPNGDWLVAPAYCLTNVIFSVASNQWCLGAINLDRQNETSWVKLPDDSILTVDKDVDASVETDTNTAERYIPALHRWVAEPNLIANITLYNEYGPAVLLPDGRALFMGANGTNLFYSSSGSTNPGTWSLAAAFPPGLGANDTPAVSLVSGNVLTVVSPLATSADKGKGLLFFEFNPVLNQWNMCPPPPAPCAANWTGNQAIGTDAISMLLLPDGTVLFSDHETPFLYVYVTDDPLLPAGKPTSLNIKPAENGVYHLAGKLLNGLNVGAVYGDEGQMDSNFPIIRLQNGANAYYCRTVNRSSTGVMTGDKILSADFKVPEQLPPGNYSLSVVANGIASDPVSFAGPIWVDFNSASLLELGDYDFPYKTLTNGIAHVSNSGAIFIKPGSSTEHINTSKPTQISAVGGNVHVGASH